MTWQTAVLDEIFPTLAHLHGIQSWSSPRWPWSWRPPLRTRGLAAIGIDLLTMRPPPAEPRAIRVLPDPDGDGTTATPGRYWIDVNGIEAERVAGPGESPSEVFAALQRSLTANGSTVTL